MYPCNISPSFATLTFLGSPSILSLFLDLCLPSMADQLLSTAPDYHSLPENYIRPEDQRPLLAEVDSDAHIPVIDMGVPDRSHVVSQIGHACRSYGFFQVSSHTHTAQDSTVFRIGSALYDYWLMFVYRWWTMECQLSWCWGCWWSLENFSASLRRRRPSSTRMIHPRR